MKNRFMKKMVSIIVGMSLATSLLSCDTASKDSPEDIERAKSIALMGYEHAKGSSSMAGDCHFEMLMKDKEGIWTITTYERDSYEEPVIATTYSVRAAKLIEFDAFIKESGVLELAEREDSNDFITDYTPWYYTIRIDDQTTGDNNSARYNIEEYKEYSDEDYDLLKELDEKFSDLYGKKISEKKEER
ncbi:hypothetical protein [Butyrivibrio sp. LC3010]|uniref:hypothetical protein n=1 Tax=Butyrivibrio sp. LC3010 TaxID=1280680 RepID=UPI000429B5E9|nr:hypothetical protein [Butyrivibrio sp. LC3010]